MSVFTPVTEEQLAVWLGRYAVGELVRLEGIPEGAENSNFRVDTTAGRFVLTLFERLTPGRLPFYLQLMTHLARHGIPCPAPVPDVDHECLGRLNGRPAVLASFLPGLSPTRPSQAQCAAVGALAARMHLAGQTFEARQDNSRSLPWWRETAPRVMPFLEPKERAMLDRELRHQEGVRREVLPAGVIHADLFKDNVLFLGQEISGVVDFYFAGWDSLLYDVAVTVNAWCSLDDGSLDEEATFALLAAYHEVRPFTREEGTAWPAMLRGAALRFWLSRLHDLHLPRSGEEVTVRNPEEYGNILRRRIETGGALPIS